MVLHTAGALWGWISPVQTFDVTKKWLQKERITPETDRISLAALEAVNPLLEEGDLKHHDGEEALIPDGGIEDDFIWP